MADGMDKAYWMVAQQEDLDFAYDTLWSAATVHSGQKELGLGVLPLRTGGFALVAKQGSTYQAWMLSSYGELRPLEKHHLMRVVSHL